MCRLQVTWQTPLVRCSFHEPFHSRQLNLFPAQWPNKSARRSKSMQIPAGCQACFGVSIYVPHVIQHLSPSTCSFPNFIQTIELFNVHIAHKICLTSILFHPTFQCSHFIIWKIKSRQSRKSSTRPPAPQARCLNRCLAMGSMKSSVAGARSMTWLGEMVRSWVQDTGATHEDDNDGSVRRWWW